MHHCLFRVIEAVRTALVESDDLRKPRWRGCNNPYAGHCYVASEAVYHMVGATKSGLVPASVRIDTDTVHWFLRSKFGIVDPTADQFDQPVDYQSGRNRGFLTNVPSARARTLMKRAYGKLGGE